MRREQAPDKQTLSVQFLSTSGWDYRAQPLAAGEPLLMRAQNAGAVRGNVNIAQLIRLSSGSR
jgi:hypothetical protein